MAILPHKDVSNLRQNETKILSYGRGFPIIIRTLAHHKIIIINENYRNIPNLTNFGQIFGPQNWWDLENSYNFH